MVEEGEAFPLVADIAPRFVQDVEATLRAQGDGDLADQVPALRVVELCGCGDELCGSFYVHPPAMVNQGQALETIDASITGAIVLLDIADRQIRFVEVIDHGQIRALLDESLVQPS